MKRAAGSRILQTAALLCCLLLSRDVVSQVELPLEDVDLIPYEPAPVGIHHLYIGIASLFGGWKYWHGDRYVRIETVPADAELALYYIRRNFQKRFERTHAPVRVQLPNRANTTKRDVLSLRVTANGFTTADHTYSVRNVSHNLLIKLAPLPNALFSFGHIYIAGRTTLVLHTTEQAQFRVTRSRSLPGFVLALTKTADKLLERPEVSGGTLRGVEVTQVGEDILIRVHTVDPEVEVRSKQSYNPIRKEYLFLLDIMSEGARMPTPDAVRRDFEQLAYRPGQRCAGSSERALRQRLDPSMVEKAFRPSGSLVDLYRREAMLQLGRVDRGSVDTLDGETLRTGNPVELELALQSALTVEGYLGLLMAFASTQDEPASVLRSLLAPAMGTREFQPIYQAAESARTACRN